ncbi:hypothetical protein FH608_042615 [Nonomuraea phyllanthi]|uniref:Uncharacterized protein n=1 Tax=Nonomuraea phyllanthi TaxID=2219224 RepID=A0A5C4VG58_9ACTN|nr:hypothetical protein [Nonomuraea phyllanthi]KAB8188778.1 hypothetical protein FH608_042615 [Nonomuraea phyllanthi]QFY05972.1 hypothetical protein GBF35_04155 [Nonomuraea phyllanthi]
MSDHAEKTGRCYACKRTFSFDPKEVTTFLIDPSTGLPPGITVLGSLRPARPEAVARSADEPICPDCVARAKQYSEESGSGRPWDNRPPSSN